MAATQRINVMALMAAIVLAIFVILFAILTWTTANKVKTMTEAVDGAKPILPPLRAEQAEKLELISRMEAQLHSHKRQEYEARLYGIAHFVSVAGNDFADVASPKGAGDPETNPALPPDPAGNAGKVAYRAEPKSLALDGITSLAQVEGAYQKSLKDSIGATATDIGPRFKPMKDEILRGSDELGKILELINTEEKAHKEFIAKRTEELEKFNALRTSEERRLRTEANLRENKITQLEDAIRTLLELELKFAEGVEPVGTVMEVSAELDRLIVNLGSAERVQRGMLFDVFQYEKGRYNEKGRIEIIDVQEHTSSARILVQGDIRKNPLAKGDRIGNPLFNPSRPKTFVLAGDFLHHNSADYESFIRAMGNEVSKDIVPGVDFLVVRGDEKDRSQPARARAREFQILGLTEERLIRYLPRTFPTVQRKAAAITPKR